MGGVSIHKTVNSGVKRSWLFPMVSICLGLRFLVCICVESYLAAKKAVWRSNTLGVNMPLFLLLLLGQKSRPVILSVSRVHVHTCFFCMHLFFLPSTIVKTLCSFLNCLFNNKFFVGCLSYKTCLYAYNLLTLQWDFEWRDMNVHYKCVIACIIMN